MTPGNPRCVDARSLRTVLIIHGKEPNRKVDLVDKRGNSHTDLTLERWGGSIRGWILCGGQCEIPSQWMVRGESAPSGWVTWVGEKSGIVVRDGSRRSGRGAEVMRSQPQKWLVAGIASLGLLSTSVAFGQASEQSSPSNTSPSQPNLQSTPRLSEYTASYPRGWAAFPQGKQPLGGMGTSPSPQYGSLATPYGVISQGAPGYVPGPSGQFGVPGAGIYGLVPGQPGQAYVPDLPWSQIRRSRQPGSLRAPGPRSSGRGLAWAERRWVARVHPVVRLPVLPWPERVPLLARVHPVVRLPVLPWPERVPLLARRDCRKGSLPALVAR